MFQISFLNNRLQDEIIVILKGKGYSFEECLETSVKYHRYEHKWLNENYKCEPFPLQICIEYYNIDAFIHFLENARSIDEIDNGGKTCLHSSSLISSLPIVQYLIEKGANIEAKDNNEKTHIHLACSNDSLPIIKYLIEKGANGLLFILHC